MGDAKECSPVYSKRCLNQQEAAVEERGRKIKEPYISIMHFNYAFEFAMILQKFLVFTESPAGSHNCECTDEHTSEGHTKKHGGWTELINCEVLFTYHHMPNFVRIEYILNNNCRGMMIQ